VKVERREAGKDASSQARSAPKAAPRAIGDAMQRLGDFGVENLPIFAGKASSQ